MAVRASKAQYEHAFSEQHLFKINSVNSTDENSNSLTAHCENNGCKGTNRNN
jgi:hypothetical protein